MDCKAVEEQEIIDRYLLGRLTESERDEFEGHYFECASCFSQVQAGLDLQEELRRQSLMPASAGRARFRLTWAWVPAFAALVLLSGAGIWLYSVRHQPSSPQVTASPSSANPGSFAQPQPSTAAAPSLEELARVAPPPYAAVVLRGAEDEAQQTFRQAMQNYSKGDYAKTIPGLRAAAKASPETAKISFYLGACYLLTDQTDAAIASFRKTVSLGDTVYTEQARFYLAKAYLRKQDVAAAETELQEVIRLHRSKEAEAGEILRELHK